MTLSQLSATLPFLLARFRRPLLAAATSTLWLLASTALAQPGAPAEPLDPRPEKRPGMPSSAEAALIFDQPNAYFDDTYQFGEVRHVFPFRNTSQKTVTIEQGLAVAGIGHVEFAPSKVPPGGSGEARVVQPLADKLGESSFRYALVTDEPGVSRYRFSLSGFVESAYDPARPEAVFGEVERGAGALAEIEISSREVLRLDLTESLEVPAWLRVEVGARAGDAGQGFQLKVRLLPEAPLGLVAGTFLLRTNVPNQDRLLVRFRGVVYGDLRPSVNPVGWGAVHLGQSYRESLRLRSRSGRPVEIESVTDTAGQVLVEVQPCPETPEDAACRRLQLEMTVAPTVATGPFGGHLQVKLKGSADVLPIAHSGLVVAPGTPIRNLEIPDATPPTGASALPGAASAQTPPTKARENAAPAAERPSGQAKPVRLHWKAKEGKTVRGYIVYRALAREGPYLRRNARLVPAPKDGKPEHAYEYFDQDVESGRTYYYYVDVIDSSGIKERFSGVLTKRVE